MDQSFGERKKKGKGKRGKSHVKSSVSEDMHVTVERESVVGVLLPRVDCEVQAPAMSLAHTTCHFGKMYGE